MAGFMIWLDSSTLCVQLGPSPIEQLQVKKEEALQAPEVKKSPTLPQPNPPWHLKWRDAMMKLFVLWVWQKVSWCHFHGILFWCGTWPRVSASQGKRHLWFGLKAGSPDHWKIVEYLILRAQYWLHDKSLVIINLLLLSLELLIKIQNLHSRICTLSSYWRWEGKKENGGTSKSWVI